MSRRHVARHLSPEPVARPDKDACPTTAAGLEYRALHRLWLPARGRHAAYGDTYVTPMPGAGIHRPSVRAGA